MSYASTHGDHDNDSQDFEPADQPKAYVSGQCKAPDGALPDPPKFELPNCPKPPYACDDSTGGDSPTACIDDLISAQQLTIAKADKSAKLVADLETLRTKARAAALDYTQAKYAALLGAWVRQDREIADLLHKLVCAAPNWPCILECYVCPLLNDVRAAEQSLHGECSDDDAPRCVYDLRDQEYWLKRDIDKRERALARITAVMKAWETPAKSIEAVIAENDKLIAAIKKSIGDNLAETIYDMFMRLVPMHLSIAPPYDADAAHTRTRIAKRYTEFCVGDTTTPNDNDACCGPHIGAMTLRQQLIKPQPYLINPKDYYSLFCCLIASHLAPAHAALSIRGGQLKAVQTQIQLMQTRIAEFANGFDKRAKAAIPADISKIECKPCEETSKAQSSY
jgi:hypothetical protein